MSAYHSPLDAYEEYIVNKRMAEEPTLADTKTLSTDDLLTGAHLWWGFDTGQVVFWLSLLVPVIGWVAGLVWWAYIQWRYHRLTAREQEYVRLHNHIGAPQPHYWWERTTAPLRQSA